MSEEKPTLDYHRPTPSPAAEDWAMLKFLGGFFGAAGSTIVAVFVLSLLTISVRATPGELTLPEAIVLGTGYIGLLAAVARAAKRSERFRPLGAGIWCGLGAALLFEGLCFAVVMSN